MNQNKLICNMRYRPLTNLSIHCVYTAFSLLDNSIVERCEIRRNDYDVVPLLSEGVGHIFITMELNCDNLRQSMDFSSNISS